MSAKRVGKDIPHRGEHMCKKESQRGKIQGPRATEHSYRLLERTEWIKEWWKVRPSVCGGSVHGEKGLSFSSKG